jgi:hypothetical protein
MGNHHLMHGRDVNGRSKNLFGEIHLTYGFTLEIDDF